MRYLDLEVMNFLSVRKAKLTLGKLGLVLIQGIHKGNDSYDSNGSGKSAVFVDAPTWVLFGITVRGLKADEVINKKAKRNCAVFINIEDDDGSVYRVARYRKHVDFHDSVMLFKDGVNITGATNDETNKKIEDLLQMDFLTFTNSVMYGQSVAKVFALTTDAEKKKIMEKMLQIDIFRECQEKAKDKVKLIHVSQEGANIELYNYESMYNTLLAEIEDLKAKKDNQAAQVKDELNRLDTERKSILRQISAVSDTIKAQAELDSIQAELDNANQQLASFAAIASDCNDVMAELRAVNREKDTKAQELTDMYNYIENLSNGEVPEGVTCPNCGNVITKESVGHLIAELNQEYAEKYAEFSKYDATIQDLTTRYTELDEQMEGKPGWESTRTQLLQKISAKKQEIQSNATLKSSLQKQLESITKSMSNVKNGAVEAFDEMIQSRQDSMEQASINYHEKLAEIDELNKQAAQLEFWVDAFGDKGIKSHLLDSVTPFLNERTDYYSQILSDGTLNVEFSTVAPLKDKRVVDKFNVKVGNAEGGDDYIGSSGGERRRIDLAILFALQDLVASRSQKNMQLIVYDEIFDALDGVGVEKAIQVLQDKQARCETVIVITHNPLLAGYFDNVINVVKEDGDTTVE